MGGSGVTRPSVSFGHWRAAYTGRGHGHTTINQEYAGRGLEWAESGVNAQSCPLAFGVGECADHGLGNTTINRGVRRAWQWSLSWMNGRQWVYAPKCVIRPLAFGLHRAWPG